MDVEDQERPSILKSGSNWKPSKGKKHNLFKPSHDNDTFGQKSASVVQPLLVIPKRKMEVDNILSPNTLDRLIKDTTNADLEPLRGGNKWS